MKWFRYIVVFLLSNLSVVAQAADGYARITTDDGLLSDYITSVYRDDSGFLWIGTAEGVSMFDGVKVTNYELRDTEGDLAVVRINKILYDSIHGLLLVTNRGLYGYDTLNGSFSLMYGDISLYSYLRVDDYLFMGGDSGVVVTNSSTNESIELLHSERVISIKRRGDEIYLLTPSSLYSLSSWDSEQVAVANLIVSRSGNFSDMVIAEDIIYIGSDKDGLLSYHIDSDFYEGVDSVAVRFVRSLLLNDGEIYVTSEGEGVAIYDIESKQMVDHINNSNAITCADVDNLGLIWMGSYSMGVYYSQIEDDFISIVDQTQDISVRSIYCVAEDRFVIGSRDGLLSWRDGDVKHFRGAEYDAMDSNLILSILPYRDGCYLIGTFLGGVFLYDSNLEEVLSFEMDAGLMEKLRYESIYDMEMVGDDLYFFTLSGLYSYSPTSGVGHWDSKNSAMPTSLIYAQCYDAERNSFWIGTSKGLCRFDVERGAVEAVELKGVSNNFRSNVVYLDEDGNILLDKDYSQLLRIDTESFEVEQIDYSLNSSYPISGIIEDLFNQSLWIATTRGLYNYDMESGQSVRFVQQSGLANTNICPNAIVRVGDDKIVLGTENGMYSFHSQPPSQSAYKGNIYLVSLNINGKGSLCDGMECTFAQNEEQSQYKITVDFGDAIEFDVVDPSFRRRNQNRYAFSLDGQEWSYPESNKYHINRNIPLGSYKLYVKISNDRHIEWSEPIEIGVVVVRLNGVVQLFIILTFVVALVLAVFRYRLRVLFATKAKRTVATTLKREPIDEGRATEVLAIIRETLEREHGYRDPKFRLNDLAKSCSISSNEISLILNSYLNVSFIDFINDYRINEVKSLLLEEDVNLYLLHVLAERCGFNSKSSFYRIFKSKTGLSPLQYRKEMLK